jgi:hypothetical protein
MSAKRIMLRTSVVLALLVGLGVIPVLAGSAVVGSVAGSLNATMGGQKLEPNTTLFSGDSLQVKDGAAVIALTAGSRMVFGRQTTATFLREADVVTVTLSEGNVSIYHPGAGAAVRVKIGELVIEPGKGYATEGEVAMLGGSVVVTAKEGTLRVAEGKRAMEVKKGQTMKIPKVAGAPRPGGAPAPAGGATSEGIPPSLVLEGVAAGASIGSLTYEVIKTGTLTCTPAASPSTTLTCKH